MVEVQTIPKKIYMGFDASGDRGIGFTNDSNRYFTIAAVTCSNFKEAEKIANWLEQRWPGKKDKHPHRPWREILQKLKSADLRYYVLLVDKEIFSGKIDKSNYNKIRFSEAEFDEESGTSNYTAINDGYAKHGWLVIKELILQGYKGPTKIWWDSDLKGYGWELSKKKVKDRAENWLGPCDLQDSEWSQPLVRIADIVANFSHWQLKEQMLTDDELEVIILLRPNVRKMWLNLSVSFAMHMEKGGEFKAW